MTVKIGINGFGRIGRMITRALYEENYQDQIQITAINDLGNIDTNAHLLRYDTTHGPFRADVKTENGDLVVNDNHIKVFSNRDPGQIPWSEAQVDIVFDCTGIFTTKETAQLHLKGGAKKVIISAPGKEVDATIVYGVNHEVLKSSHSVISNASCTTNCLAPIVKVLNETIGIEAGLMNTIHAYTNDQVLVDAYHSDVRRARAATMSMIPTKTGAAASIGLVLPEMAGKLDGLSLRVPVINVSVVDLTFIPKKPTTPQEINDMMEKAANNELKGILAINKEPLVSSDFNHHPASSIFDATQTRVTNNCVKILSWYDNEWGFSNRMLDVAIYWHNLK